MEINMTELRVAADELEIDLDNLVPAIEEAILNAYLKQPGAIKGAYVRIDRRNGEMKTTSPPVNTLTTRPRTLGVSLRLLSVQ